MILEVLPNFNDYITFSLSLHAHIPWAPLPSSSSFSSCETERNSQRSTPDTVQALPLLHSKVWRELLCRDGLLSPQLQISLVQGFHSNNMSTISSCWQRQM